MIELEESKFGFCCCYSDCTPWLLSDEDVDYEILLQQFYAQMLGWA